MSFDHRCEPSTWFQATKGVSPVAFEARRAEQLGHRGIAVAQQQGNFEDDGHALDQAAGPPLDLGLVGELAAQGRRRAFDSGVARFLYWMPRLNQVCGSFGSCRCTRSSSAMPASARPALINASA